MAIAIALGGALGAVGRHFVAGRLTGMLGAGFPYGTLGVNVLGSFLMGLLVELIALKLDLPQPMQAFLTVGFLGGFTTFSTFSMEVVLLMERQTLVLALAYVALSVTLTVAAFGLGLMLVRQWLI